MNVVGKVSVVVPSTVAGPPGYAPVWMLIAVPAGTVPGNVRITSWAVDRPPVPPPDAGSLMNVLNAVPLRTAPH